MKILYWLSITLITGWLISCTMFSPVPVDSQNKYVLNTLPHVQVKKSQRRMTLSVARPDSRAPYRTKQIAYSTQPYQIAYFAKNSWVSYPAEMLHALMIQSLQNTHYFHAVIGPSMSGEYDYSLNTQLESLLQDYTHRPGMLRLTVRAEIVRVSTNKIIATKQFVITEPIAQPSPYSGVTAANRATAEMLQQLTQFCLNTI